ncbi:MAG: segregation ATPase FtsK/SpoIIIE, family, partial [Gaiellaceae bacterium]|nr:segregation ATPase FtsK/SpoIIIE, family [Gaiellaceae bacterium]
TPPGECETRAMASSTRTRRPARKRPAASAKKPPARKPAARKRAPAKKQAPPLVTPRQAADLGGLLLTALASFGVLVLWLGWDGAFLGNLIDGALRDLVGRVSIVVPPLAGLWAALLFSHGTRPRLRPVTVGAALIALALLIVLSDDRGEASIAREHGGILGAAMHGAVYSAMGEPGVLVLGFFGLAGGILLITGASVAAVTARLHSEVVETARAVRAVMPERVAIPVPRVPAPRAEAPAAPPRGAPPAASAPAAVISSDTPPFDGETVFPDLFERDAPETIVIEPAAVPEPVAIESEPEPTAFEIPSEEFDEPLALPRPDTPYRLPDASSLVVSTPQLRSATGEERVATQLLEALGHHGIEARLVGTVAGPRVTRYEIQLAPGTKVGKVEALQKDLAYALATTEIRILAPIPGKQAVGVEVPNLSPNIVTLGDVNAGFSSGASPISVWLGKDIAGQNVHCDLAKMPHILIAGTTGSGKSGCVNAMLVSILLHATPEQVRMILIDPKKVELNHYEAIPHLLTPVVTNVKQAAAALLNIVGEMERRYERLGTARTRNIIEFNRTMLEQGRETLPYVLVVIDELADLMMVSPAEVEDAIIRLAQKSRAVGIHLVLATQRPSVDVITGMIKANVPSRIAFAVSSQTDSRVILDSNGAEALLGQGDMLYRPLGTSRIQRVQGAYVTEEEIALVVGQCRDQGEPEFAESLLDLPEIIAGSGGEGGGDEFDPDSDPLLNDAIRLVINHETASVSLIQRRLRVGYTRAGRLIDMLERRGVISGYEGSKPRQVLISEADLARVLDGGGG